MYSRSKARTKTMPQPRCGEQVHGLPDAYNGNCLRLVPVHARQRSNRERKCHTSTITAPTAGRGSISPSQTKNSREASTRTTPRHAPVAGNWSAKGGRRADRAPHNSPWHDRTGTPRVTSPMLHARPAAKPISHSASADDATGATAQRVTGLFSRASVFFRRVPVRS